MASTLALRNPPSYLGAASQLHSARNDRLTIGALWTPGAGSAASTPLAVAGGAVYGPAGTMGEVTLNTATQITVNPARWVVPGGIDSKQGHYEAIHDQVDTLAVTAQDATLYRRSYLAVVVDDSESSGVASSATTDRGTVQVIDGPLAASNPAYPVLTAYPNRLLLGEFYIPPTGQTVTWTPYNPRTTARGGVLPVLSADSSTVPGNSGAPGTYVGQYRDHPTLGLQRWNGTAWTTLPDLLPIVNLRQSVQQSLASGWTIMNWQTVDYDPLGMFSAANPSRIAIPKKGVYRLSPNVVTIAGSAGQLWLKWMRSGGANAIPGASGSRGIPAANANGEQAPTHSPLAQLNAGDYLEVSVGLTGASGSWSTMVQSVSGTAPDGLIPSVAVECVRLLP